jgi:predicted phage tail component-like protein
VITSFTFNNMNSYNDFGIYVSERPDIPSPKRRVTTVTIPGRNSTLRYDENTYEDITLTVKCALKNNDVSDKVDEIKGWLIGAGEGDLTFNFQPDKKYVAQVVNSIDFTQVFNIVSEFPIVFNCRPFKYAVDNSVVTMAAAGKITNPGTIYSEPIIKVYGSGDVNLTIGSQVVQLTGITNYIIIDGTIQDCYDEDMNNLNNKMNSEFPILNVGDNNISWTGTVTQLEITPNWRWL